MAKGIQVMGLRRTRYVGLAKTHLQHVLTTVAMNVARIVAWLKDEPLPKLRVSRFGALAPAYKAFRHSPTETISKQRPDKGL